MQASRSKRYVAMLMATAAFPYVALSQQALPTGGQFTSGDGAIHQQSGGLIIDQTSTTGIVEWNGFSIGSGNFVHFDNGRGATLNRVTGNLPSQINGSLTATGSIYLVNKAGIVVGNNGVVDTGGSFYASTHDVGNAAFNAQGDLTFSGTSKASVVNLGTISSSGGNVALIARSVRNDGTMSAPKGTVGLVAGYEVLAKTTDGGDGLFSVRIGGSDTKAVNSGTIAAANAEMRANGGSVYALAGNTSGLIKATGASRRGGRIFLTAGDNGHVKVEGKLAAARSVRAETLPTRVPVPQPRPTEEGGDIRIAGGTVIIDGTVDASGHDAAGGTVVSTGTRVSLAGGAMIDVSGTIGGTALIGGDYQGGQDISRKYLTENVATADTVTVATGATIRADGTAGTGGRSVVWSDFTTTFKGAITATGAGSAAGGEAEVSGKALLDYQGTADLRSESGPFGTLLLDPYNLTISSASGSGMSGFNAGANDSVLGVSTLTSQLATANVTVTTGSGGSQTGNITVAAPVSWTTNSVLTLNAAGSIQINKDMTADGSSAGLRLVSGGGYSLNGGARVTLSGSGAVFSVNGNAYTLIHDVDALQAMSLTANYALGNDIDAKATAGWNSGAGFMSVGHNAPFTAILAGLGHAIDGLTVNRPSSPRQGLFGYLDGTARDLTLSNAVITSVGVAGVLAGRLDAGTVINVHATGSVTSVLGGSQTGGLIGWQDGGRISGSSSSVAVIGVGETGGLVGRITGNGTITNSYATGSVDSSGASTGGFVGEVQGGATFSNVYASGKVAGTTDIGGLVGAVTGGTVSAVNAYWDRDSTGQVTSLGGGSIAGATSVNDANTHTAAAYAFDFTNTGYSFRVRRGRCCATNIRPWSLRRTHCNSPNSICRPTTGSVRMSI